MRRFYSFEETMEARRRIASIEQDHDETLAEAWERFQDLIRKCPHHSFDTGIRISFFYDGLDPISRANLDSRAGGSLMNIAINKLEEKIEEVVRNSSWGDRRREIRREKMGNGEAIGELTSILKEEGLLWSLPKAEALSCSICGGENHNEEYCRGIKPTYLATLYPREFPSDQRTQDFEGNENFLVGQGVYENAHMRSPKYIEGGNRGDEPTSNILAQLQQLASYEQKINELPSHNKILDAQITQVAQPPSPRPNQLPSQPQPIPAQHQAKAVTLRSKTSYLGPKKPVEDEVIVEDIEEDDSDFDFEDVVDEVPHKGKVPIMEAKGGSPKGVEDDALKVECVVEPKLDGLVEDEFVDVVEDVKEVVYKDTPKVELKEEKVVKELKGEAYKAKSLKKRRKCAHVSKTKGKKKVKPSNRKPRRPRTMNRVRKAPKESLKVMDPKPTRKNGVGAQRRNVSKLGFPPPSDKD